MKVTGRSLSPTTALPLSVSFSHTTSAADGAKLLYEWLNESSVAALGLKPDKGIFQLTKRILREKPA
jgi:hypothetical protein